MYRPVLTAVALALLASTAAQAAPSAKSTETPSFCQTDPTAHFKGAGSNYCAPTALSDGLIYLAKARGVTKLAPQTGHDGQVALIKSLSSHMGTDPTSGTSPAGIMKGMWDYAGSRHVAVDRLEYAGWRDIGATNRKYSQGKLPSLAWLQAAAANPDAILLLNVGWYKAAPGGYKRDGGHWVDVVGSNGVGQFILRNPSVPAAQQASNNTISLTPLDGKFKTVASPGTPSTLAGYFQLSGPGLPVGRSVTPVLDCALVFTVKR